MKGILGKKVGMTQVFTKSGKLIPVTVIEVEPNVVTQIKTVEKDGYEALQVGYEEKRVNITNKPSKGIFDKANTTPKKFVKEISGDEMNTYNVGDEVKIGQIIGDSEAFVSAKVHATVSGKVTAVGDIKLANGIKIDALDMGGEELPLHVHGKLERAEIVRGNTLGDVVGNIEAGTLCFTAALGVGQNVGVAILFISSIV